MLLLKFKVFLTFQTCFEEKLMYIYINMFQVVLLILAVVIP